MLKKKIWCYKTSGYSNTVYPHVTTIAVDRYIRNLTHLCNAPVIIIIALNLEKLIVTHNQYLLLLLFSRYENDIILFFLVFT